MDYNFRDGFEKDKKSGFKFKLIITLTLFLIICGIIIVNINLADVIKGESSFLISFQQDPPRLIVDLGEKNVILSTKALNEFKDGITVIIDAMKNTITSLKR